MDMLVFDKITQKIWHHRYHFRINHEQLFFLVLITRDRTSIEAIPIGCFSGTTLLIIHGADKSLDTEDYSLTQT